MATLPTNYVDAVFSGNRKYTMVENSDGTISFKDATTYDTEGSYFGADDINTTNETINGLSSDMTDLKKSVSDGKSLIAAAITEKNVTTSSDASYATMAANIASIVVGGGTATASDILSGKTKINEDGTVTTGTMTNKSGTTTQATPSLDTTNSRLKMTIPANGYYNTSAVLYSAYSTVASLIGLTAAKLATGNTVMGVTGSYTGVGTATAARVLTGYTFSNASSSGLSGTMSNLAGTTSVATASLDTTNSRVKMTVPSAGYYDTAAALYATYSTIRSLIGLTAAKVKKGETILGITGTWEGWVTSTNELYSNGVVGSLGGSITTAYTSSDSTIKLDTSCIVMKLTTTDTGNIRQGFYFSSAVNLSPYSKITIKFNMVSIPSGSSSTGRPALYIAVCSSISSALYSSQDASTSVLLMNCTTSTNTLTLDVSNINSTEYIMVYFTTGSYTFSLNLTYVALS